MIDSYTKLYAVFGKPVRHSQSPAIHNCAFRHYNINAVYLAFEINNIKEGIAAIKTLNIQGASITLPFKKDIINYLDHIDEEALAVGAVNAVVNRAGKLEGYNTDLSAAIQSLKDFGSQFSIKGKKVCIIGAGGAAQTIAFGINKEKGQLTIINKNTQKGEKLAEKYNADFIPLSNIDRIKQLQTDILINATPVGMSPNINETPFPADYLTPNTIVMDIIYTPLKTRLLTEAQARGCATINGLPMFLHQGAAQFRLWTGISPDVELMRKGL